MVAVAVLAAVGAGLAAGGCGGDRDALTIYSGRTEDLVGPLLERFSEEEDVAIDVRYGDTPQLALLLAEEGDRTPADVFWGQSPGATAYLAERDLLAPLSRDVLDLVDPGFEDPEGLLDRGQRPPAGAGLQLATRWPRRSCPSRCSSSPSRATAAGSGSPPPTARSRTS